MKLNKDVIVSQIEKIVYEKMRKDALNNSQLDASRIRINCGTIDVLRAIQSNPELFPDCDVHQVSLILGADTYADLMSGKWKEPDQIIQLCSNIHVFDRNGQSPFPLDEFLKKEGILPPTECLAHPDKFVFHHGAITDPTIQSISSTQIRRELEHALSGITKEVFDTIIDKYPNSYPFAKEYRQKHNHAHISDPSDVRSDKT